MDRGFEVVADPREGVGLRCVATRPATPASLLFLEVPAAITRAESNAEWELTKELARSQTADLDDLLRTYAKGPAPDGDGALRASTADSSDSSDSSVPPPSTLPRDELAAVSQATGMAEAGLIQLHRVVCGNAFGLHTPVLGVEYGAAFYTTASRFNHSCDPNCLSIRLGGTFALFALKGIEAGDELTHSYLPLPLVIRPQPERAAHLHFPCACPRCLATLASSPAAATRSWPPEFETSPAGKAVAAFRLATGAGQELGISPAAVLELGCDAVTAAAPVLGSGAHPFATLDLCLLYLAAFWAAPASPGAAHAGAAARLCAEAVAALASRARPPATPTRGTDAGAPPTGTPGTQTRADAHPLKDAHTPDMRAHKNAHTLEDAPPADAPTAGARTRAPPTQPPDVDRPPGVLLELLGCATAVLCYLTPGGGLRETTTPVLCRALARLSRAYGGGWDFLRDDLPIIGDLASPTLADITLSLSQTPASSRCAPRSPPLPPTMHLDVCGRRGCTQQEAPGGEGFKRCARCKGVKYCGGGCQKAAWRHHKLFCAPPD
eukprot:m.86869 g.86869  ORF g.86869 m.86869 type:complete len:551 (+) comp11499_c0_seq1:223-1875(+)